MEDVWDFVSSPKNLKKITPEYMNFSIKSGSVNEKIYPGMIISYKVSPILRIPTSWVTEITHVKKNKIFVDEQRLGPYKIWHHEHLFVEKNDGVLMIDIISYKLPFGILGRIINYLFIKNKIKTPQLKSSETKSFSMGVYQVLIADLTLSFDNTIAVVAASKGNFHLMVIGLLLSVFLIATLASFFAEYIKKHMWLGYLGLFVILVISIQLIIGGLVSYEVLSINDKYKFLFL